MKFIIHDVVLEVSNVLYLGGVPKMSKKEIPVDWVKGFCQIYEKEGGFLFAESALLIKQLD